MALGDGSESVQPGLEPLVEMALADLSQRLAVEPTIIVVESARLTVWNDRGFLGGPMAELRQTQVPTDGSEIVLICDDHAGTPRSYRYRTGGGVYRPMLHLEDQL